MKANEYVTDFDNDSTWGFVGEMGITIFKWLGWEVFWVIAIIVVL